MLFLEVRDSTTGALLGRGTRPACDAQHGSVQISNSVTNLSDFRALFKQWADISVKGFKDLRAMSPVPADLKPGQKLELNGESTDDPQKHIKNCLGASAALGLMLAGASAHAETLGHGLARHRLPVGGRTSTSLRPDVPASISATRRQPRNGLQGHVEAQGDKLRRLRRRRVHGVGSNESRRIPTSTPTST